MRQWLNRLLGSQAATSTDATSGDTRADENQRRLREAYRLLQTGDTEGSARLCRKVLAAAPDNAFGLNLQAILAHQAGRTDEAIELLGKSIQLNPRVADFHFNLGVALQAQERHADAAASYRTALALEPRHAGALTNLGRAFQKQAHPQAAIACYEQAVALKSDLPEAHWGLATQRLLLGDFAHGWEEYEHRWALPENQSSRREFAAPRWTGDELAGRRLLLHAEQGVGDMLQFVRYAPLLARRGARVIVLCQPELKRLLVEMEDVTVVTDGDPLPDFDVHLPLMSLSRLLGTTLSTIPANVPYLRADPVDVRAWSGRLAGDSCFKVGLVWAGNPRHLNDRNRSCTLATFAPLADVTGIRFYSLQKGEAGTQARNPPANMKLVVAGDELFDFADTAALMASLDLVITVDTAAAHLAGALARPVWVLLPFAPDWRWLLERGDSPWYPSMRLFRQKTPGDWRGAISEVVTALRAMPQTT